MAAILQTVSTLAPGSTSIVVVSSNMNIDRTGLATVEAQFVFRTTAASAVRSSFEKGKPPPVSLNKLDLAKLQGGNVFLTDVSFEDRYGLTHVRAQYAGARFINIENMFLDVESTILNVTKTISTKAKPAYWTINVNQGGRATTLRLTASAVGRNLYLGVGGTATYTPARESQSLVFLDSVWKVHSFTYRYALLDTQDHPPLTHPLNELVIPVSGNFERLNPLGEFLPVISDRAESVNSRIALYTKTFSAERVQGLTR